MTLLFGTSRHFAAVRKLVRDRGAADPDKPFAQQIHGFTAWDFAPAGIIDLAMTFVSLALVGSLQGKEQSKVANIKPISTGPDSAERPRAASGTARTKPYPCQPQTDWAHDFYAWRDSRLLATINQLLVMAAREREGRPASQSHCGHH